MSTLIATHDKCLDGSVAAWVASKACREESYRAEAFDYTEEAVNILKTIWATREYDRLLIVDYSVKLDVLYDLEDSHPEGEIVIIDHHKTAFENLLNISPEQNARAVTKVSNTDVILDMTKSGCLLAWEYFYGTRLPPDIVVYVNDHDLWRYENKYTKPIIAYLKAYFHDGMSISDVDMIDDRFYHPGKVRELVNKGEKLIKNQEEILNTLAEAATPVYINGIKGYAVTSANPNLTSELGHTISNKYKTFAMIISFDSSTQLAKFSLRCDKEFNIDCSHLAKQYGGGGHRGAAGFYLPVSELLKVLDHE